MTPHTTYEFGPYRLEGSTRRLSRGDELIPLAPKAFDILLALIDRRDRVVDKAELMKLVWPDSFVEEANLSQTIFVLRKALGDAPDGNPYIQTVPRRGYRFSTTVREIGPPAPDAATITEPRRPAVLWWGLASGALILLSLVLWITRSASLPRDDALDAQRIVVLPFENLTQNRDDNWLASAFSDSLSFGLHTLPNVVCVTRDRVVELYRELAIEEGASLDADALRRIVSALGVSAYVHGSYQRVDGQLRVIVRVVESNTGTVRVQVDATAALVNLLTLEDDLSSRLAARLAPGGTTTTPAIATTSIAAYRAVIEGRTAYARGAMNDALRLFEEAIALDAQFAEAWAMRAKTKARLAAPATFASGSLRQLREGAILDAQQAVALDQRLYEGHAALALAYRASEQATPWRAAAERAIELNPRLPEAFALLGDWYGAMPAFGCHRQVDAAQAERYWGAAQELDPRHTVAWSNHVYHLIWMARPEDAVTTAERALAAAPASPNLWRARAMALLSAKRIDEADQQLRDLSKVTSAPSFLDRWMTATIQLLRGQAAAAATEFETILSAMSDTSFEFRVAWSYFLVDRIAKGVDHLDRALTRNPECSTFPATSPLFAPYREHPQFRARLAAWKQSGS